MENKNSSLIVVGEASESDEDNPRNNHEKDINYDSFNGAIMIESENDSDDNYNLTAEAFASKYEETKSFNSKYSTLLHKKLKESNSRLHEDTTEVVKSVYRFANEQIKEINCRLVESLTEAKEAQKNLRSSLFSMEVLDWEVQDLVSKTFLPNLKCQFT